MALSLKPTHATVKAYYDTLHDVQLHFDHEGAVRGAFQTLLAKCGQRTDPKLTLIAEYPYKRGRGPQLRIDGALVDTYKLPHGYWEAKDEKDDLAKEVQLKLDKGYPSDNTIFQAPERAILYQRGTRVLLDEDITRPEALVAVVNQFFEYKMPHIEEWERAVNEFSDRVPELSQQVESLIKEERRKNPSFRTAFDDFYALTRQAINPNLSEDAVERMLIQHLLTERIFRRIFKNDDFRTRNVVAAEIEKVIAVLTKRSLNRDDFLKKLEPFYHAIERNAENATDYTAKQDFLNTVYMRFFQGYSPKEADTHGIVYTPQPIVNFMVRSVEEILQKEFGRSLGDKGVHILDPFVGTGNFITRIMQEIKTTDLPYKYENELHCNEVMLLPYYIASMNIEHAYYDRVGEYKAFPGICLVDTFELAEAEQASLGFMTAENAERVQKQKGTDIFVVIGNPPYNAQQVNENDNNQNRKYKAIDRAVADSYARDSTASLKNSLGDPYVKALRWASNRISEEGVVAFVTNNSFINSISFDGMRQHLARDFSSLYLLDLGGNVRQNPKLSGTTNNVFGVQVGVSINLLLRRKNSRAKEVYYATVDEYWRKEQKLQYLDDAASATGIPWQVISPDSNSNWLTAGLSIDFEKMLAIGSRSARGRQIFDVFSNGVKTNRDTWAYNFDSAELQENIKRTLRTYREQLSAWQSEQKTGKKLEELITLDPDKISWSAGLKQNLERGTKISFDADHVRVSLYRPFTKQHLYFDVHLTERRLKFPWIFPTPTTEKENLIIAVTGHSQIPFSAQLTDCIPCIDVGGRPGQCFPFYTYAEDGTHRRENITDWALDQFRSHYADPSITKWDIFHYVYAILHHPEYRERYAANLRRELPRIPFAGAEAHEDGPRDAGLKPGSSTITPGHGARMVDPQGVGRKTIAPRDDDSDVEERPFRAASSVKEEKNSTLPKAVAAERSSEATQIFHAFVQAGRRLAEVHVHYEQQDQYPLTKIEKKGEKLDYAVKKMKLSKDKTQLIYNQFLTLADIPKETFEYRLGNRSALEWIVDQYQVSTDKRSGITNDPNREDDPTYILRLIGQVVTVSLETVKIVASLPKLKTSEIPTAEISNL